MSHVRHLLAHRALRWLLAVLVAAAALLVPAASPAVAGPGVPQPTFSADSTPDYARVNEPADLRYTFTLPGSWVSVDCSLWTPTGRKVADWESCADHGDSTYGYTVPTQDLVSGRDYVHRVSVFDGTTTAVGYGRTFTWDTTRPDVSLTGGPPAGATVGPVQSFTFASTDTDVDHFLCGVDSRPLETCTSPYTFSFSGLGDGTHYLKVFAIDQAGNGSAEASRQVVLDSTAPSFTIESGPDGASVNTRPIYRFSSGAVDLARFECRLDGAAWTTCTSPYAVPGPLLEAGHSFGVRAVDEVGNTSSALSRAFTYDVTAPALEPDPASTPAGYVTNRRFFYFGGTATESGVTRTCQLNDGQIFSSCNGISLERDQMPEGTTRVRVFATDAAGNRATISREFIIDRTAPQVPTVDGPVDGSRHATAPTYTFIGEPGATFRCAVDGGPATACTSPWTVPGSLSDGSHTVSVTAVDQAGNVSEPTVRDFVLDRQGPEVVVSGGPVDGSLVNTVSSSYYFYAIDLGPVDRFECRVNLGTWTTCAAPFAPSTGLQEGLNTIAVRAVDDVGNVSARPAVRYFVYDTTAPTASITDGPDDGAPVSAAPTYGLAGTDARGVPTLSCALDDAAPTRCDSIYEVPTSGLTQGIHTVTVRATDRAGNASVPVTRTFVWDTQAPYLATSARPDGEMVASAPSYTFWSEADATFTCSVDRALFVPCASPYVPVGPDGTSLEDGTHEVVVRVTDRAGNSVDGVPHTFVLDTTAPTLTFGAGSTPDGEHRNGSPTYTFAAADANGAATTCSLDSADSFVPCTSPYVPSTTGLSQGAHVVRVRAVDPAGHATTVSRSFVWDTVAPSTSITTGPADGATVRGGLSYAFSSVGLDVARFECAVDGGAWRTCASGDAVSTSGLGQGVHTFAVRAVDDAGNVGVPVSRRFRLDDAGPSITVDGGPADGATVTSAPTYRFYGAADDVAGKDCRVDGGRWTSCSSPWTVPVDGLADGSHTVSFRAYDDSGNLGEPTSRTFVLDRGTDPGPDPEPDTEAPAVAFASGPADGASVTGEPTFGFTSDADDLAGFECAVDGGVFTACASPFTTAAGEGTHRLSVRAVDESGNTGEAVTRSWTSVLPPSQECTDAQGVLEGAKARRAVAKEKLAAALASGNPRRIEKARERLAAARVAVADAKDAVRDAC